ncbi:unnamed protein product [Rhizoctonia solani]|uniref:Uncharacterized protein n=1 Tax=Rhizoctonia solani TaxID=456999 RepID=A0A8H3GIC2_9AGAM|nr:unnamed protein product [Rhizoctonia solani]
MSFRLLPKTPTQLGSLIGSGATTNPMPVEQGSIKHPPPLAQQESGSFEHPLGTKLFYQHYIVSTQNLSHSHMSIANHILGVCDQNRLPSVEDVTVCLHITGTDNQDIEYYVVNHVSKTVLWEGSLVPETSINTDPSHELEYWIHMRNFPGHRPSTTEDFHYLKDVLNSNSLAKQDSNAMLSDLWAELASLEPYNPDGGAHQTYTIGTNFQ